MITPGAVSNPEINMVVSLINVRDQLVRFVSGVYTLR